MKMPKKQESPNSLLQTSQEREMAASEGIDSGIFSTVINNILLKLDVNRLLYLWTTAASVPKANPGKGKVLSVCT